jgi:hypothetical protein
MDLRDEQAKNPPASDLFTSTIEDLLAQIEHEATCRRREARALRRRIRRQRRQAQPVYLRVVHGSSRICSGGLALVGVTAFIGAGVVFLRGDVNTAKHLLALASAAWSGVAGMVIFSRR